MPRVATPLTDPKCEAAKPRAKDYKLFDGQGLFLLVKASGVKSWRLKYTRPDGREGLATFGNYPALGLKAARARRDDALALLAQGIDPIEAERTAKQEAALERANTFELTAREWHATMSAQWKPVHANAVLRRLELHLFPVIGSRPLTSLKTRDLMEPLKEVESRGKLDLAQRLRHYIGGIMRLAVQRGLIEANPAPDLLGSTATRKHTHRPALPFERLPELVTRMENYQGRPLTRMAVQLALLVFIRSSELRFARWEEIDFDRALWTIPGERQPIEGVKHSARGAKMGSPHLVPLSQQAVALLRRMQQITGRHQLVLAGDHGPTKPLSENTVNAALRRMGYDTKTEVCGHGFRSMACSALIESGLWSRDAVERQMSHQERNGVRAAYIHKAEHMEERRLMCQWWADYLDACQQQFLTPYEFAHGGKDAGNVVTIKRPA